MPDINTGVLYFGDNLEILRNRDYFPDGSVDLIYLDPPFNSRADYNVLFREPTGERSAAQIKAFTDTWHWDMTAERAYQDIVVKAPLTVSRAIAALREFIGSNDVMAYLVMMTARLVEMHRVLKDTGSLYLHCDPTASHYLKVVLDTIFGTRNFRNEIVWKRQSAHSDAKQGSRHFGRIHDTLLRYTKSDSFIWNTQHVPYDQDYIEDFYKYVESEGGRRYTTSDITGPGGATKGNPRYEFLGITRYWRYSKDRMQELYEQGRIVQAGPGAVPREKRYLDEMPGVPAQDIWTDLMLTSRKERLGYQTQKPVALLERIIRTSSNEGDVVLDPFCGCGTAVVAAQRLNRRWIGIDITYLAINVMNRRLRDSFGLRPGKDYEIIGRPVDVAGAEALARRDRYQFQWWALDLVDAQPREPERKKGADAGVDGVISFVDNGDVKGKVARVIVQVKSGKVDVRDIRDLKGVVGNENLGLFITLQPPSEPMRVEAVSAGFHHSALWKRDFPRIQIFTIEQLLKGERPDLPARGGLSDFTKAARVREQGRQVGLGEAIGPEYDASSR